MSDRIRLTWDQDALPSERARAASAHPAYPDEGAAHPAHTPDPGEHDYENGDTSSWAEDPTTGPYPNSAHPATPDEGAAHPAHKQTETTPSVAKAAAQDLRAAVDRKARRCCILAESMLGASAPDHLIEDQALDLMEMPDHIITAALKRLAEDKGKEEEEEAAETVQEEVEEGAKEEKEGKEAKARRAADERLLRKLLAEEDMDDEEDEGKEANARLAQDERLLRQLLAEEGMDDEEEDEGKEASSEKTALDQILAALTGINDRLSALEGGKTAQPEDEDEALLAKMLAEEEEEVEVEEEEDVEAMLRSMLEEDVMVEPEPVVVEEDVVVEDPMGLGDDEILTDEDETLLATLFAEQRLAAKKGQDEEEEEEEEESEEEESEEEVEEEEESEKESTKKKAAQKPRAKKASTGASRLGTVSKTASDSDMAELEKLWPTAPDVSKVFE